MSLSLSLHILERQIYIQTLIDQSTVCIKSFIFSNNKPILLFFNNY